MPAEKSCGSPHTVNYSRTALILKFNEKITNLKRNVLYIFPFIKFYQVKIAIFTSCTLALKSDPGFILMQQERLKNNSPSDTSCKSSDKRRIVSVLSPALELWGFLDNKFGKSSNDKHCYREYIAAFIRGWR